jgi:S-adenosylmethionine hydrolase
VAIVTLTTDFGTTDGYVGAMKGVLLARAPGVTLIDITHSIKPHDVAAAAYALANAVPYFPSGTIHVAVVDPGVGGKRKGVIVVDREQIFVGPDNGIFSLVVPRPQAAYEIAEPEFRRPKPSATFHGRDVFAAAAARLVSGGRPDEAGPQVVLRGRLQLGTALENTPNLRAARVLHVDVFGNLITNVPGARVPDSTRFRVAGREIAGLSATFESVAQGELLAYVGSRNTVEIAVREGNAAELLGASRGTVVELVLPDRENAE